MLKTESFDFVSPEITDFYYPETERFLTDARLFNFNNLVTDEIVNRILKKGYTPANLRELLDWAKEHWHDKSVIALGQTWQASKIEQFNPYLKKENNKKYLDLILRHGKKWTSDFYFLGVKGRNKYVIIKI